MFLQIDHIAFSSAKNDEAVKLFETLGYSKRFSSNNVPNPAIKRKLVSHFTPTHDLVLMDHPNSISIEFIDYGYAGKLPGYVLPIFDGLRTYEGINESSAGKFKNTTLAPGTLDIPICVTEDATGLALNKAIINTSDVSLSMTFWKFFGFNQIPDDTGLVAMEFLSILKKQKFVIYLRKSEPKSGSGHFSLDDNGFNCIALISNSASNEHQKLSASKVKVTEIESVSVNGKVLDIFFAIGPGGEIVEVLSLGGVSK
ncbi:hypothetical protein HY988_05000 [Candidatus Micrarchaeota archaeon]|nr:hypothetical protein [Candidatus Micrarchaeota archaeon]